MPETYQVETAGDEVLHPSPSDIESPNGYYVASASGIGLPEQNLGPMADDSEFLGEMFNVETGIAYVALASDADSAVRGDIEAKPQISVDSSTTLNGPSSTTTTRSAGDEVLVVISRYTGAEVLDAMDIFIEHFEKTGIVAPFGYEASFDAINIGGNLTQEQVDELPDIGVQYYVELGIYQDDYHSDKR